MRGDDQDKSAPAPPSSPGAEKSFLGPEFVTWLFFHLEAEGWMLELPEAFSRRGLPATQVAFAMGEKAMLRAVDAAGARVTLAGPDLDDSGELLQAVRRGALIDTLELQLAISERVYTFTLRAPDGGISSVKLPDLGPSAPDEPDEELFDEPDGKKKKAPPRPKLGLDDILALRMAALEEIEAVIDALFERFVTRRVARAWHTEDVASMRKKVDAGLRRWVP